MHRGPAHPAAGDHGPGITVLGSLNMDLVLRTSRLPAPGETTLGGGLVMSQGGKGANQAIAAARAGARVSLIGAVGSDDFGDQLTAALLAEGIDADLLRHLDGPSGIAVITVDDAAENTIVVAPGANGRLIELTEQDEATIAGSTMLIMQLEVPTETVTAAARVASATGVPVLLNPSPVRTLPAELLDALTLVIVNEGEHNQLGHDVLSAVPHVVTTLGAAGARYRGPGAVASASPPKVTAIDTTGAGDAFTGALAVAWTEGADPAAALAFACAAGALATTRAGASAPTRREIDRLVGAAPGRPQP
jgi:ribokinase